MKLWHVVSLLKNFCFFFKFCNKQIINNTRIRAIASNSQVTRRFPLPHQWQLSRIVHIRGVLICERMHEIRKNVAKSVKCYIWFPCEPILQKHNIEKSLSVQISLNLEKFLKVKPYKHINISLFFIYFFLIKYKMFRGP